MEPVGATAPEVRTGGYAPGDAVRAAVCALIDQDRGVAAVLQDRMAFRDIGAFTTFPFLAIGHTRIRSPPSSPQVEEHAVTVHLWLEPGETAAAQRLMQVIRRALDQGSLRLGGADVLGFSHESSGVRLAPELEALHATIRYRLRLTRKRLSGSAPARRALAQPDGTNPA
ncbi:MAG: DUF3168 domain-containing protein [Hyphomicrobiaceae bacterium]|nr:DUF3168 domain-containing protein [Hyphomicrobiaceae bacterium]